MRARWELTKKVIDGFRLLFLSQREWEHIFDEAVIYIYINTYTYKQTIGQLEHISNISTHPLLRHHHHHHRNHSTFNVQHHYEDPKQPNNSCIISHISLPPVYFCNFIFNSISPFQFSICMFFLIDERRISEAKCYGEMCNTSYNLLS